MSEIPGTSTNPSRLVSSPLMKTERARARSSALPPRSCPAGMIITHFVFQALRPMRRVEASALSSSSSSAMSARNDGMRRIFANVSTPAE